MCNSFNRQGTQCAQCISGYGPDVFSDSISCADCSKYEYFWIINLMFQLTMVTLMCLEFMIFQVKGTSSPLNIVIAYIQNVAFQCELSVVYSFGQKLSTIIITILNIWNLDCFRLVFRPLCISSSLNVIDVLAIYPPLFIGKSPLGYSFIRCYRPNSALLLFDPSIRFLHPEHVPCADIALFILLTCIIQLVLYPTKLFRKCVDCLGFQRWDVLHHVTDIFQGWYKDGTEGTSDYRFLSAFFLVLRIAQGGKIVTISLLDSKKKCMVVQVVFVGVLQILIGVLFFVLKPCKKLMLMEL